MERLVRVLIWLKDCTTFGVWITGLFSVQVRTGLVKVEPLRIVGARHTQPTMSKQRRITGPLGKNVRH